MCGYALCHLARCFSFSLANVKRIILHVFLVSFSSTAMPSGYPRITESPTLKAVEKDRNTVMLCSAVGNPDPTIMWLKDFIPVDLTDPRLKLLQTGKYSSLVKKR